MTVRTPGLTWVRIAPNVTEMLAILQAANLPGCEVDVREMRGAPVASDVAAAASDVELPQAA